MKNNFFVQYIWLFLSFIFLSIYLNCKRWRTI